MDAEEIIDKNGVPALHSPDVGTFSQTKITRVLKSKFKAKPEPKPIRIVDKTHRCIKLEQKYLDRIKSGYDIPDKIEIITKQDKDKQTRENVTDVTDVTLPGGILQLYSDIMSAKITAISQNLLENSIKNEENYTNQADTDTPKDALASRTSVTSVTSVTNTASNEIKCPYPNCYYEETPFYMKLHKENAHREYNCPVCKSRKKKSFKTNDLDEYKKHWIELRHKGEAWKV